MKEMFWSLDNGDRERIGNNTINFVSIRSDYNPYIAENNY